MQCSFLLKMKQSSRSRKRARTITKATKNEALTNKKAKQDISLHVFPTVLLNHIWDFIDPSDYDYIKKSESKDEKTKSKGNQLWAAWCGEALKYYDKENLGFNNTVRSELNVDPVERLKLIKNSFRLYYYKTNDDDNKSIQVKTKYLIHVLLSNKIYPAENINLYYWTPLLYYKYTSPVATIESQFDFTVFESRLETKWPKLSQEEKLDYAVSYTIMRMLPNGHMIDKNPDFCKKCLFNQVDLSNEKKTIVYTPRKIILENILNIVAQSPKWIIPNAKSLYLNLDYNKDSDLILMYVISDDKFKDAIKKLIEQFKKACQGYNVTGLFILFLFFIFFC